MGEASERAAGSEERPQGRSARQQCREESLGPGGSQEPSAPQGAGRQQASHIQLHHKATFFLCVFGVFLFVFFSFFFFSNSSKEESKGRCVFFSRVFLLLF